MRGKGHRVCPWNGGNLIYSAPTSGGKTLVAEILMYRRLCKTKKGTILFVVPFKSLCDEKAAYFTSLWQGTGISVQAFHGELSGNRLKEKVRVAVCTTEKAAALLNGVLKQQGNLDGIIGLVRVLRYSFPNLSFLLRFYPRCSRRVAGRWWTSCI